jgi:hypothetical protein
MKDLTTISTDLFNKVRSRFSKISMGDESGALTTEPETARFFDITYRNQGRDLGRVNLRIDDHSLTVIYDQKMTDSESDDARQEWFDFLKELRQFARKNLLTFDTRDIAKSNLDKRDYQYLAQKTGEKEMSESKLFGTSKTSYQDIGEAKIIVKHSAPVNYDNPAGRTQRIESIYIESSTGERFRYPAKHLNGARAMAVHVANGGNPYDGIGSHISGLSEELSKLRQFKNYTQRSGGAMAEAMGDISQRVMERIDAVKHEVASLQKQAHYESFRESFAPSAAQEVPEDMINSWVDALTIRTFNEELKGVFPYIYKLVSEKREGELNYDDLVAEETECGECGNNPCSCDDETTVKEHSMFNEFEQSIDDLATLEYEQQPEEVAEEPAQSEITEEVMEFIASMYDREAGTFPRGEEGVKIAVEKKFGEQASQFADYVVEKLSVKSQGTVQEQPTVGTDMSEEGTQSQYYYEKLADEVFALNPNLDTSGRADDVLNAAYPLMVRDLGQKGARYKLNYDEDFPSDFVSAYGELKKGGAVNQQSTEGSDELLRIRQLSGF